MREFLAFSLILVTIVVGAFVYSVSRPVVDVAPTVASASAQTA